MRQLKASLIVALWLCCTSNYLQAQTRCGADELLKEQLQTFDTRREEYAKKLNEIIQSIKQRLQKGERTLIDKVYKIPVVVHIMHYASGTDYNISDEAVDEQIRLINDHFKEMHESTVNIPEKYEEVRARDTGIEFHLARRDPLDFPTTGITRTVIEKDLNLHPNNYSEWREIRPLWSTSEYMNIYVSPPSSLSTLAGIATFPSVDIPGLAVGGTHPTNGSYVRDSSFDGIVISTVAFGTLNHNRYVIEPVNGGVTASHEVGHYLGLFHTFQDCDPGDYCSDTPSQSEPTSSRIPCANNESSCAEEDMTENYMDYSNDRCLIMFTICQRIRMRASMESSLVRRSVALDEEKITAIEEREDDFGIIQFSNSSWNECSQQFEGSIFLGNYGTNLIRSVEIALYLNDREVQRINTLPRDVLSYDTLSVPFDVIASDNTAVQKLSARILRVNGRSDSYEANNIVNLSVYIPTEATELNNLEEQFFVPEDAQSTAKVVATSDNEGQMLRFEMINSPESSLGKRYVLLGPRLNFSEVSSSEAITLSFRYSHRGTYNKTATTFNVYVSDDCSLPYYRAYYNEGLDLNTSPLRALGDKPQFEHEWRSIQLPIRSRSASAKLLISVTNGRSGNLYVDDIQIIKSKGARKNDLELLELIIPEISCSNHLQGVFSYIDHSLDQAIEEVRVEAVLNNLRLSVETDVLTGDVSFRDPISVQLTFRILNVERIPMSTELRIELFAREDPVSENNFKTADLIFAPRSRISPPSVDKGMLNQVIWMDVTHSESAWRRVQSNIGINHFLQAPFYNQDKVTVAKLISPTVDLSSTNEASISFNVSYAKSNEKADRLQLFVFENCVPVPAATLYDKSGDQLAVTNSNKEWAPFKGSDWRQEIIDISKYVGKRNLYFMFVATGSGGNNIYLDNIEIHKERQPNLLPISDDVIKIDGLIRLYPNPSAGVTNLVFDLRNVQDVEVSFLDLTGQSVWQKRFKNISANAITLQPPIQRNALYFVKIEGEDFNKVQRFILK